MSDEHALVDLDQRLFDDASTGIGLQQRKGSTVSEARDRSAQPGERPLPAAVCGLSCQQDPGETQDPDQVPQRLAFRVEIGGAGGCEQE